MTTENIIPVKRDIEVLLRMDSYQDMTDEEIESIIEYKVESAVRNRDCSALVKKVNETSEQLIAASNLRYEEGMKMYNAFINRRRNYTEVKK